MIDWLVTLFAHAYLAFWPALGFCLFYTFVLLFRALLGGCNHRCD